MATSTAFALVVSLVTFANARDGFMFAQIGKLAAEAGESICGNLSAGTTIYLQDTFHSDQSFPLSMKEPSFTWRGPIAFANATMRSFSASSNCTMTDRKPCFRVVYLNGTTWKSKVMLSRNKTICSRVGFFAFERERENKTVIGRCLPPKMTNLSFIPVKAVRTDLFFKEKPRERRSCNSDTTIWSFKEGCGGWGNPTWTECSDPSWGAGNFFTFGGKSVYWITELEVNSNHMNCKLEKLANMTTHALSLLNEEEGELRDFSMDNRLALDLLLARQGGLCKYIGKRVCCTNPDDFQGNVSRIIDKMHEEIERYHRVPVHYGLDPGLGSLFSWLHWVQWLPIIVLIIIACVFLRR